MYIIYTPYKYLPHFQTKQTSNVCSQANINFLLLLLLKNFPLRWLVKLGCQVYAELFRKVLPTQAIENKSKHQQSTIVETLNVFIGLRWVPCNACVPCSSHLLYLILCCLCAQSKQFAGCLAKFRTREDECSR